MVLTSFFANVNQIKEPRGYQVNGAGRGCGSVHGSDQLAQAKLPLYVGLRLRNRKAVKNEHL